MDFYEELIVQKAKRKLSNKQLGAIIGMEGETFRMAISRKSLSGLQIKEIEKFFDSEKKELEIEDSNKGVPYYDVDFTASFLEVGNNQQSTPTSYISHPFFAGCDYVVRASGQSMAKVISHGDAIGLIKVENWRDFFPFGEIYAIVTKDNFRMIKVITKGEDNNHYTLISKPTDSKKDEFPPQQIKINSILHIFRVQASSHLF
jgi:phage repressor protein C with HTH and peptisase S24 domain